MTRLGKDIRHLYVADVDPIPNLVPARMLLPSLQLFAPHVRAIDPVYKIEQDGGAQASRKCYEQPTRRLERASPWSSGYMVDVRFEHLSKLGGYEWRETVPVEHLSFLWTIYQPRVQDIPPAVD